MTVIPEIETGPSTVAAALEDACRNATHLRHLGRSDLAQRLYQAILQAQPAHAGANHGLGMLHVDALRPGEGLPLLLAALNAEPWLPGYWLGYLEALLADGRLDETAAALTLGREHGLSGAAVDDIEARLHRARARFTLDEATAHDGEQTLLRLVETRQFGAALVVARAMTTGFPRHATGWKILGALLVLDGQTEEAVAAIRTSLRLMPDDAETHSNLGMTFIKAKRFEEAEAALQEGLRVDPGYAPAHYRLAMCYELQGRYPEAESVLRAAMPLRSVPPTPDDEQAYSQLMYMLSYNPALTPEVLFAEHCRYGEYLEGALRASWPEHRNPADPQRRLKVGFVSGDLFEHAVGCFMEPVLARLSRRPDLELHAYYNHGLEDAVSARLKGWVKHWHPVTGLPDAELARQITADGIDILIDLSGHTGRNRLGVFARKPAPIQVSWLGYPGTTGLTAMDYYLAERHWLPPGECDRQFTEKLVYLPDRWAFEPHPAAPAVNALPALAAGHLTFGSFNRLGKVNRDTVRLWSTLLRALPDATMLLGGMPTAGEQRSLIAQFAAEGIEVARLQFHGRVTMDAYLALHHQVDLCLDTQPYAGGTTTMHALWMGVPTLTVTGATSFARAGAGILGQLGLDGFTATDATDFVARAMYWAAHPAELAQVRAALRVRMQQSTHGQPDHVVAALADALRQMWQQWCAKSRSQR